MSDSNEVLMTFHQQYLVCGYTWLESSALETWCSQFPSPQIDGEPRQQERSWLQLAALSGHALGLTSATCSLPRGTAAILQE